MSPICHYGIVVEVLAASDDFAIEKITDIIHGMHDNEDMLEDLSRCLFIAPFLISQVQTNMNSFGQSA